MDDEDYEDDDGEWEPVATMAFTVNNTELENNDEDQNTKGKKNNRNKKKDEKIVRNDLLGVFAFHDEPTV